MFSAERLRGVRIEFDLLWEPLGLSTISPLFGDVEQREEEDPDDVDEVPVDANDLDPVEFFVALRGLSDEEHDDAAGDDVRGVLFGKHSRI